MIPPKYVDVIAQMIKECLMHPVSQLKTKSANPLVELFFFDKIERLYGQVKNNDHFIVACIYSGYFHQAS